MASRLGLQHISRINLFGLMLSRGFSGSSKLFSSSIKGEELFFNTNVQRLLRRLTGMDLEKVFAPKKLGKSFETPQYRFMTDAELKRELDAAREKAESNLQMPPVMDERKPFNEVISCEPALEGLETSKIVAIDINLKEKHRHRLITVREPDGTLRKAEWDERDRMLQIFFPREGKQDVQPPMFETKYLKDLLSRGELLFVLDRACVQFEPDEITYIQTVQTAYNHVNDTKQFDLLHSTRHFGSMVFYLVRERRFEQLLLEYIRKNKTQDAVDLISVFHLLHQPTASEEPCSRHSDHLSFIKTYVELDSTNKDQLERAVQTLESALQHTSESEEQSVQQQSAHGSAS